MSSVEITKKSKTTVVIQDNAKTEVLEIRDPGVAGPPNNLTIGTVITGNEPDVTISGIAPNQVLDFVIPIGGTYVHTQYSASNQWTINHNLGYQPNVTVVDSSGSLIEGNIQYTTPDSIVLLFSASFAGTAYLS